MLVQGACRNGHAWIRLLCQPSPPDSGVGAAALCEQLYLCLSRALAEMGMPGSGCCVSLLPQTAAWALLRCASNCTYACPGRLQKWACLDQAAVSAFSPRQRRGRCCVVRAIVPMLVQGACRNGHAWIRLLCQPS